jgi:hypothetical protein
MELGQKRKADEAVDLPTLKRLKMVNDTLGDVVKQILDEEAKEINQDENEDWKWAKVAIEIIAPKLEASDERLDDSLVYFNLKGEYKICKEGDDKARAAVDDEFESKDEAVRVYRAEEILERDLPCGKAALVLESRFEKYSVLKQVWMHTRFWEIKDDDHWIAVAPNNADDFRVFDSKPQNEDLVGGVYYIANVGRFKREGPAIDYPMAGMLRLEPNS